MRDVGARLAKIAEAEPLVGAPRTTVLVLAAAAILAVRVVDDVVADVSFGVFYMLPVAVAAILCTGPAVFGLALVAAVAWSTGEQVSSSVLIVNSAFRSVILLMVVFTLQGLGDAARRARRSERRSQEFLAFIAHQLRTPTATASATAQTLLAAGADAEHEEAYLRISRETQRIGQLVSATLRYVRADQDPHPRAHTDLVEVCRAEVTRQQTLAPDLALRFEVPAAPIAARVSGEGVTEALSCLIDNARRHARSTIVVRAEAEGGDAVITVADDGPGMTPIVAEKAFEPFVALDGRGGTGLGLAIARRLTEVSGGSISYGGEGFVLRFPLVPR